MKMAYSWHDDRLNFTGDGTLSVPTYTWKWKTWFPFFENVPPYTWIPTFEYTDPTKVGESASEKFFIIQKVR